MADVTAIREGIAAAINAAIPELQMSAWQLANPTPPAAHVFPDDIDWRDASSNSGITAPPMKVQVLISDASGDIGAQQNLDAYIDDGNDRSIKRALEQDPTLGGACSDLFVASCSGARFYQFEGRPPALGAEWRVEVLAPR